MRKFKMAYIKKINQKKGDFHYLNKSLGNFNSEVNNIKDYY
jgi:hypothetical protein